MPYRLPFVLLVPLLTLLALLAFGAAPAQAQPAFRGAYEAYPAAAPLGGSLSTAVPRGLRVAGRDEQRGAPTLVVGHAPVPHGAGATAARRGARHLERLAPLYGLAPSDLRSLAVVVSRATRGGGDLVVFGQRVDGIEVFDTRASLLLDDQGGLRVLGGQLHPAAGRPFRFRHDPAAAVTMALADCWGRPAPGARLVTPLPVAPRSQSDLYFVPSASARTGGYALDRPARAQRVLFPMPTRLIPATYVELWVTDPAAGPILIAYVVSAEDGAVLSRRLLTADETFRYTVYADTAAPFLPVDSPFGDVTPDAAGAPVDTLPSIGSQGVVAMEAFNTNPAGGVDPWLPAGATETRGNNADAYADLSAPDGFGAGDLRATTTAPGVFDYPFDAGEDPSDDETQQSAVVTQLFYVGNWLHDYFYDLGFDEAAGNAQDDNFGRGGEGGDALHLEAMDYGGTNNANMNTPRDGSSPRMQMFLWSALAERGVDADGASYDVGTANWGPSTFDLTAPTALVSDGVDTVTDACEAVTGDLTGFIALVDRGGCSFWVKVLNAQAAGALGVIVMNNRAGGTTTMGGTPGGTVTIPSLFVSQADGAVLRGAAVGTNARLHRAVIQPRRDSSLDATVLVHEWGHYLHNRLVPGGSIQRRSQGEGWGDLLAAVMLSRPSDDFEGAHPHAGYANLGREFMYFGTRRVPYSTSRAINDLSFRHISVGEALPTTHPLDPTSSNNAEVHNAGEVWATMMFDAFASLVDRTREAVPAYGFDEARSRFASYIVLGMQLAPRDPTYTEQRDAVIAAALDNDLDDAAAIAGAFARRGAGTCAVSPERGSTDLVGVVEDFTVGTVAAIEGIAIDVAGGRRLCDGDDLLDAGEDGLVRVVVRNTGLVAFDDGTLELTASEVAVVFPLGATWPVGPLGPGESVELAIPVTVDEGAVLPDSVEVAGTLRSAGFCRDVAAATVVPLDRNEDPATVEAFERLPSWFAEASLDGATTGVWSVVPGTLGGATGVLRAEDTASLTDTAVELPEVTASATTALVLAFEHRFDFEAEPGILWDGGVIELSTDGGAIWVDVDRFLDPGYTGPLSDTASSPLSLRPAYSGVNPSSPAADVVSLDFGTAFAGMAVRFRFRVGTDMASGGAGWEIDDISLTGGDPAPFTTLVADLADCADAPSADAGFDFEVYGGELFALDATESVDPNGDALSFFWAQLSGDPLLAFSDAATATPELTAPLVDAPTDFEFQVRVSDGGGSSTDDVRVRVLVALPPPDAGLPFHDAGRPVDEAGTTRADADVDGGTVGTIGGGGCSCRTSQPQGADGEGALAWGVLIGLVGAGRLRRRLRRRRDAR